MKTRIAKLINLPIDRMWVGTFHSLSLRILRQHHEEIGLKKFFNNRCRRSIKIN